MVAISIHPLPNNSSLVVGYNNATQWAIEGVVRVVPGTDPDVTLSPSPPSAHKIAYTATSVQVRLNVSSGAQVATKGIMAVLGNSAKSGLKWNGMEHLSSNLELVPQTHEGANAVVVREGEEVDLPFRFEFNTPLPPTCEIERGRFNAFSRYRLSCTIEGRPHRAKHLLEARKQTIEHDVACPFYDNAHAQALCKPSSQSWKGSTDELDWEVGLGSIVMAPGEFATIRLKAALYQQRRTSLSGGVPVAENPIVAQPSSAAFAGIASDKRKNPAPFIRRATFTLMEDAMINLYTVPGAALPQKKPKKAAHQRELLEREIGGGSARIVRVEVDGEHLERGHELKVQLPGLAPVCAIPGSKLDGKYKAQVDKKMSTGDVSAVTETAVQINPTGSWGSFQVTHVARVLFEVADGHNVLWEAPVIITSASTWNYQNLLSEHPSIFSGQQQQQQRAFTTSTEEFQEQDFDADQETQGEIEGAVRKLSTSGAISVERPAIPTVRMGSDVALAAAR